MLLTLLLMAAEPIKDDPRPTGIDITSPQPLMDLQACVTRAWVRVGKITPIPIEKGVALDFQIGGLFGGTGKPITTYEIRDAGDLRHLTVRYRHPMSAKSAVKGLRDTAKRCFPESLEQFSSQ